MTLFRSIIAVTALCLAVCHASLAADVVPLFDPSPSLSKQAVSLGVQVKISPGAFEAAEAGKPMLAELGEYGTAILTLRRKIDAGPKTITWVAAVETDGGPRSAVLTEGPGGIFGVMPSTSGELLELDTRHGETRLRRLRHPSEVFDHARTTDTVSVGAPASAKGLISMSDAEAEKASAAGDHVVDLLGIYTDDVVRVKGSEEAAQTYFRSLVALANQAFVDSGAVVRLNVVGLVRSSHSTNATNGGTLNALVTNSLTDGLDVHALRNSLSADLVALLREGAARVENGGIAQLLGGGLAPATLQESSGYSVSAFGGYVLAHEVGHNLGSEHDIETQTASDGSIGRGAYLYSHGHRQAAEPSFHTVMAYRLPQHTTANEAPVFSHVGSTRCFGAPCGIGDVADNARSLTLMAARVARLRNQPNMILLPDLEIVEPGMNKDQSITVRLSSAQSQDVVFDVVSIDGTASAGTDYVAVNRTELRIPSGQLSTTFPVRILADEDIEPTEDFDLRIQNLRGAALELVQGRVALQNDDPRVRVTGRILFDGVPPPPGGKATLYSWGADGPLFVLNNYEALAPDYRYEVPVVPGTRVDIGACASTSYCRGISLPKVDRNLEGVDLVLGKAVTLTVRLIFPEGQVPTQPIWVQAVGGTGIPASSALQATTPSYQVAFRSLANVPVRIQAFSNVPAPFVGQEALGTYADDAVIDLVMTPEVSLRVEDQVPQNEGGPGQLQTISPIVWFSDNTRSPVSFRVRTIAGGTATPGEDYQPVDTVMSASAGTGWVRVNVPIIGDDTFEPDETIRLQISDPVSSRILKGDALITIRNDDPIGPRVFQNGFEWAAGSQ